MAEQVRVGVIGTSWWSDLAYLPHLAQQPRAVLAAICGRDQQRANEMARKYAVPQVFGDYREMIERGNLDAVVVAAPDDQHYPMTMAALDAGLHVICEKPVAMNALDAQKMTEKAEASGVKHLVYFAGTWFPHTRYLQWLVDDGFVGRPMHCNIRYIGGYARGGQYQWRFDANRANGVLGDLGSHMIQAARSFIGEIASVSANLAVLAGGAAFENPANDYALLNIEFVNGARGSIEVSAAGHIGNQRNMVQGIEIYGDAGSLESTMELGAGAAVRGLKNGDDQIQDLPIPDEYWDGAQERNQIIVALAGGIRVFVDAILDDKPLSPNLRDGLVVQRVIDAAIESDRSGRRVAVK